LVRLENPMNLSSDTSAKLFDLGGSPSATTGLVNGVDPVCPVHRPRLALYVHVPFCARKCDYCAFYSHSPNQESLSRYVDALLKEADLIELDFVPETIFFGGGTPSLLPTASWARIGAYFADRGWNQAREWTVECNPATLSRDKAQMLKSIGVNRISMGVQSLNEALLEGLGRIHTRQSVFQSYDLLRSAGFDRINLDLMFAIPGQEMSVWRETIAEASAMDPDHFACYEVIYEEDTPLFDQLQSGKIHEVDEATASEMYSVWLDAMDQGGWIQYEVANFAKDSSALPRAPELGVPDQACLHNTHYWLGAEYHALGPSACGFINGIRTRNISNTEVYCRRVLDEGLSGLDGEDVISPLARAGEIAAFGLRMNAGWNLDLYRQRTGFDFEMLWRPVMKDLECRKMAVLEPGRFRLTREGMRFADAIGSEFLVLPD
jgi:oxygen-independent coproporphyrinogen III oxidase